MLTDWITLPLKVDGIIVAEMSVKLDLTWRRVTDEWEIYSIEVNHGQPDHVVVDPGCRGDDSIRQAIAVAASDYWCIHKDEIIAAHDLDGRRERMEAGIRKHHRMIEPA